MARGQLIQTLHLQIRKQTKSAKVTAWHVCLRLHVVYKGIKEGKEKGKGGRKGEREEKRRQRKREKQTTENKFESRI